MFTLLKRHCPSFTNSPYFLILLTMTFMVLPETGFSDPGKLPVLQCEGARTSLAYMDEHVLDAPIQIKEFQRPDG